MGTEEPGRRAELDAITPAERRVYVVALRGLSVKEIAAELVLSEATVSTHLSRIYAKLGVRGRAQLMAAASMTPANSDAPQDHGSTGASSALAAQSLNVAPPSQMSQLIVAGLVASFSVAAALAAPLSSLVLGPGLALASWKAGRRLFGGARALVALAAAALVAEAIAVALGLRAA